MERRAKLFGLDAPNKIAQTNTEGTEDKYSQMSEEELDVRLRELYQKTPDEELAKHGICKLPESITVN